MKILVALSDGPVDQRVVKENEVKLGIKFPKAYKRLVSRQDGASLVNNILVVYDRCLDEEVQTMITFFPSHNIERASNIIWLSNIMATEYEQPDLIPFAKEGAGDKICFDYRGPNKTSNDPPIVYWSSQFGEEEGKNPSPLAPNFLAFMEMLRPDPDHPADENAIEVEI